MKDKSILCLGDICPDLLIPFGDARNPQKQNRSCQVSFSHGGSIANTASGLGKLGASVLFCGTAGDDGLGRQLKSGLEQDGVDVSCLRLDASLMTMQVLIVVDEKGERCPFAFPSRGNSQFFILPQQLPSTLLQSVSLLHCGGITLQEEPSASTQLSIMEACKKAGIPVSFDINARMECRENPFFWANVQKALSLCDILLGSLEEELLPLSGGTEPEAAIKALLKAVPVVVAREGAKGAAVYTDTACYTASALPVAAIDTVGAGDAYNAGFLYALSKGRSLAEANRTGCICGSVCVTRQGARNVPDKAELSAILQEETVC